MREFLHIGVAEELRQLLESFHRCHGRATSANIDQLETLLAVAQHLSLKPLPEDVRAFVSQTMVLPALDEETGIRGDFIFSFTPYESQAILRAKKVRILNQDVCFAVVEDLIIHKIFAGRTRDIEDVQTVILKNSVLDVP